MVQDSEGIRRRFLLTPPVIISEKEMRTVVLQAAEQGPIPKSVRINSESVDDAVAVPLSTAIQLKNATPSRHMSDG